MQYMTDFQVQYTDRQRQMARVNADGWKFDPPTARKRVRNTIAQALITLAARLTAPVERPIDQPRTA